MSTPKWVSIKSKWNWGSPRSNHSDSSTVELCPFVTGLGHRPCGPLVPSVIYWQLLPNDFIIHFIPEVPGGSQTCFGLYWGGWGVVLFDLPVELSLALKPWPFCLSLASTGIIGMCHHIWPTKMFLLSCFELAVISDTSLGKSVDTSSTFTGDNVDKILSLRER